jgi:hypothetical protein
LYIASLREEEVAMELVMHVISLRGRREWRDIVCLRGVRSLSKEVFFFLDRLTKATHDLVTNKGDGMLRFPLIFLMTDVFRKHLVVMS